MADGKFRFPDENVDDNIELDEDIQDEQGEGVDAGGEDSVPVDAPAEGEVDIEVVDDTPPEDRGRTPADHNIEDPTEEELAEHKGRVQKRLRELTKARHDERRKAEALARENAELVRAAQALAQRGKQMEEYINMGQTAYIEKSKQHAAASIAIAKDKLRQAYDAGDSEAITAAQEQLTTAQLQLQEANNYRATPLHTEAPPAYNPPQGNREPQAPAVDDRTLDWAARNPWFQREGDEDMTGYAMGVHAKLVREHGNDFTRTPDYFRAVDSAMRKAFPERFGSPTSQRAPADKRPSTVVAPAQRTTRAKKIRLTQTQVNIAKRLGVSLEGYARQMAALEKDNG